MDNLIDTDNVITFNRSKHDRQKFFNDKPQFEFSKHGRSAGNFEKILAQCSNGDVESVQVTFSRLIPGGNHPRRFHDAADELTPDELVERVIQADKYRGWSGTIGSSLGYRVEVGSWEDGSVTVSAFYEGEKYVHFHGAYHASNPPRYLRRVGGQKLN